jgi:hypothetical protein
MVVPIVAFCAEKSYFLPKLQNRPRFTHFLFLIMGALLEKKKRKKIEKKS